MIHQPLPAYPRPRSANLPPERVRIRLRLHPDTFPRHQLARLARQAWLNLPLEYPEFSFERLTLAEHQVELMVLGPPQRGSHPSIRGVLAHYKAMVTRLMGLGRSVWRPGYSLEPMRIERPAFRSAAPPGRFTPAYLRALIGDREK